MKTKNSLYLVLTIVFVILSVIGGYFLYQVAKPGQDSSPSETIVESTPIPTEIPIFTPTPIATSSPVATSSTKTKLTPTPTKKTTPTSMPLVTSTPKPTSVPISIATATPTPTSTVYNNDEDGFSVEYSSNRKLYQDTESSGRRYTFYLFGANFAIHVGLNDKWAWTNPDREFTSDFTVASQDTFYYEISTQTIVDFQYNDKNYTIQCVHNGKESLKTECDNFIQSFTLQ